MKLTAAEYIAPVMEVDMIDTVRNFAIDWQYWASDQSMSYGELAVYQEAIKQLAEIADETGDLYRELVENGVL